MKFLVLSALVAISAAAPQGFLGLQGHPNGAITPIDEPRVAAAKAEHLATKFGHVGYAGVGYAGYPYAAEYAAALPYAAGYGYTGPLAGVLPLVAHPNGAVTPVDEPAVAAARADHLAAKGAAYSAIAPVAAVPHFAAAPVAAAPLVAAAPVAAVAPAFPYTTGYAGPLAGNLPLVAHPNGAVTPVDEPAVAAARAEHLAAHGGIYGGVYAGVSPAVYAAGYAPYAGLVAHPNGAVVPVDEPAVAAARAEHLAAHGF